MQDLLCQASLSLGQLRLMPKVGQRGQLIVKGFSLQKIYKLLTKVQQDYNKE
jgi:hypothetical protein